MAYFYVPQSEEFQEGTITSVDEKGGIAWLHFPYLQIDWCTVYPPDIYTTPEGHAWEDVPIQVPVATEELVEAGIDIKPGQALWAFVNATARDRGDVRPHDFLK